MNRQDEQIRARRVSARTAHRPDAGHGHCTHAVLSSLTGGKRACAVRWNCPKTRSYSSNAAEFSGRKNQKMLISAMPELPNAVLLLPGRGALLEDCRTLAQQKGVADRVRFPGFTSNIEQYYRAADLCVSSSRSEGLPFNVMEPWPADCPRYSPMSRGTKI